MKRETVCRACGLPKTPAKSRLVCKPCATARARVWALAHPDRTRANQTRSRRKNRAKTNAASRARYAADPAKYRAQSQALRASKPDRKVYERWYYILQSYGITRAQWEAAFEAQGRRCACCQGDDPRHKRGWHTDHNHETGEFRGILCHPCNIMLGGARDKPKTLRLGARYLERTC